MYAFTVGRRRPGGSDYHLSPIPTKLRWYGGIMRICSIEACGRKHYGKGYCVMHWKRFKAYSDPLYTKIEMHGMYGTPEYRSWNHIKERCLNTNGHAYHRYGGRGITICDRWRDSFIAFFADMGLKPFSGAEIDRIDNNGNYEPENCHWVTQIENTRKGPRVKLNMKKAEEIRKRYKVGGITQATLAIIYGLTSSGINAVVNNKTWA